MTKLRDWLVAAGVLLFGRGARRRELQRPRLVERSEPSPGWEIVAALLLLAAAAVALATPFLYAFDVGSLTQWLGLSLGGAFVLLAAALLVLAKRVIVTEELAEHYPPAARPFEQEDLVQIAEESAETFSRGRLLLLAGGAALGALGVALITPAASLGPVLDVDTFFKTPWRRGRRLVDEEGKPLRAADIEQKVFYTAYPEGAEREQYGAPVVIVRLDPKDLHLPSERRNWAPGGILAYSKICTHAGCAISLYRVPTFPPVQPRPALVCPCHYSTFDPARAGEVLFGPAGRPLPQLPLRIDGNGELRAAGNFSGAVGPSWWGVRNRKPTA
jgi:ubiquinol-cytochrome c reductase iron-sulfur subunit